MRILFIGDVVGGDGRRAVAALLPQLRRQHSMDFVIVNGENAAGGRGITQATAEELFAAGVDVITTGNHIWDQREVYDYLDLESRLIRPINYPPGLPGRGRVQMDGVLVINVSGRAFLANMDCPFRAMDDVLAREAEGARAIIVDFHAEATSEKVAMGFFLDGRVSAVIGTHTHVPTADQRILAGGTAHVSDVGMVGALDSVLGMEVDSVLRHLTTLQPARFRVAEGPVRFNSVVIEVDEATGHARSIERLDLTYDANQGVKLNGR